MWVARDENKQLFLSVTKPVRNTHDNVWKVSDTSDCTDWMLLDESLFPELKWEDEPKEVFLNTGYDMANQINHVWTMLKCTQEELAKAEEKAMYYATKYEAIKNIVNGH